MASTPALTSALDALFGALAHAHRRAHAQLAQWASRAALGKLSLLGDVLDGDQALELKRIVDHQQALQLVLVEQRLGFEQAWCLPFRHGHQLFARRHDLADRDVVARLETQVAPGDDAHHLAAIAHRKAGDAQLL
jgi:hypothetical protein